MAAAGAVIWLVYQAGHVPESPFSFWRAPSDLDDNRAVETKQTLEARRDFCSLVSNVVDADLLEQTASVLFDKFDSIVQYVYWQYNRFHVSYFDVLLEAIMRLLATDTSIRVKVTVAEQLWRLAAQGTKVMDRLPSGSLRKSIDDVNHPHWHVRTCIAMRKIDVLTCTHGIPADAELMEAIKT